MRAFDPKSAQVLKLDGLVGVYRTNMLGRDVVLKRWDIVRPWARLRSVVRTTRAFRHWRTAKWILDEFHRENLFTARCFALIVESGRGMRREWLVMEALPGKTVLQHLADRDLSVKQEHYVAWMRGWQAVLLFHRKLYNNDPKPSNMIVTDVDADPPAIAAIDCVGIKSRLWIDSATRTRMLARMVIEAIGVGLTPRRALLMRCLLTYIVLADVVDASSVRSFGRVRPFKKRPELREARKQAWRDIAEFIALHCDPTPRINPLTPPR